MTNCTARDANRGSIFFSRSALLSELDQVLSLSPLPTCIGVNNRDLATFETNVAATLAIAPHVPRDMVLVSESGIENADQAAMLYKAGVSALLVGESLMRAKDPGKLIGQLRGEVG